MKPTKKQIADFIKQRKSELVRPGFIARNLSFHIIKETDKRRKKVRMMSIWTSPLTNITHNDIWVFETEGNESWWGISPFSFEDRLYHKS